jgi:hypothetical protein
LNHKSSPYHRLSEKSAWVTLKGLLPWGQDLIGEAQRTAVEMYEHNYRPQDLPSAGLNLFRPHPHFIPGTTLFPMVLHPNVSIVQSKYVKRALQEPKKSL